MEIKEPIVYFKTAELADEKGLYIYVACIESYMKNIGELYIPARHVCYDGKPILRPLSDLTKEIKHNDEWIEPIDILAKMNQNTLIKYV